MAWIERIQDRNRRSRSYQDDVDASKRVWSGGLAALHYQSTLDSGIYDAELDVTPVRVDVAAFDGWRVTANDWHYALGKDITSHGDQDGWVGFGGRQGAHWFKFRLLRVGYLRWSQRAWDDIGGAPNYDRANLSQETHSSTIGPNDDEVNAESVATWANIWNTPDDGALDVRWRVNGDQLKEEIVINQAGREWIVANHPPPWPSVQSYFGFVFQLDWSDVPKIVRDAVEIDLDADFADDDQNIELRDALDRLLAFLPISDLVVRSDGIEVDRTQLRKRFWFDGSNHYLLVGVRCDVLNGLAGGDLVFDPTIEEQVGAAADDGVWGGGYYSNNREWHGCGDRTSVTGGVINSWQRFTSVAVPNGATIDSAYASFRYDDGGNGNILSELLMVDEDSPTAPVSEADADGRDLTAGITWDIVGAWVGDSWYDSPELKTIVQTIVDRGGWASGQNMVAFWKDDGSGANVWRQAYSFEENAASAPKFTIEYSAAGPTYTLTAARRLRQRRSALLRM